MSVISDLTRIVQNQVDKELRHNIYHAGGLLYNIIEHVTIQIAHGYLMSILF